ncbi:MAG: ABC transporter permease [Lachnospiraceae bacterium]|nr:ABC transporter permease [Lachnospiraceae bacterium]
MTQFLEYVKMALMNIKSNKGRSLLTMLGIIIGISSVIMVISIGNGVSAQINEELNKIAGGQLYFYSGSMMGETVEESVRFTTEDFTDIEEKIEHVKGVSPSYQTYGSARSQKGEFTAYVYGGTVAQQYIYTEPIVKGRYFNKSDYESGNRVCIIREGSAIALFGTTDVIGESFETIVDGMSVECTIIGIRQDNASSALSGLLMYYDEVEMEIPLTTMGSAFGYYVEDFSSFYVFTDGPQYATDAAGAIMRLLRSKYQLSMDSNAIQMQDFNDSMKSITQVIDLITVFVVFVAAISLLVGGIGVMNIMLVSVTERTREIGIRKALGARTASIMLQFLAESAIITLLGGVIGIILGVVGANLVCGLMGFTAKVTAVTILITTLFSTGVGLFFGIYPARKAAKMSPIEALRHD